MAEWRNGGMAEWQDGGTVGRWDGGTVGRGRRDEPGGAKGAHARGTEGIADASLPPGWDGGEEGTRAAVQIAGSGDLERRALGDRARKPGSPTP